jgi:uncharacterized protein (TIGR00290 family)
MIKLKKKAIFNWSSGKDSAFALYKILQNDEFEISTLLTSVNSAFQRVSMHGIRVELLQKQAENLNLPLHIVEFSESPTMEEYEATMQKSLEKLRANGDTISIFGDIFLEDLRKYREEKLKTMQFEGVFPLWKIPTDVLISDFLALGFKTIVVCVNEKYLDKSFVGRIIDEDFIKDLPENVDVCGENGEFHTFCFDGPIFKNPVEFEIGEIVHKKYEKPKNTTATNTACDVDSDEPTYGFWFVDLIPKNK